MQGFIYPTDLLLEEKDYGGSCHGAEGTAVPQCSVPHYCFLMRRSEGLQQVSHLATRRTTVGVVPHISDDTMGFSGRWCIVLKACGDTIKSGFPSHTVAYFRLTAE